MVSVNELFKLLSYLNSNYLRSLDEFSQMSLGGFSTLSLLMTRVAGVLAT